jgi:hypothetical protein
VLRAVAVIVMLFGVAGVARAVELVTPAGKAPPGNWQTWADSALVPTVKGRVTIRRAGCPGLPRVAGCVYTKRPRVIDLKRGLRHPRGVLLHELGHVYDLTVLSNKDRSRFRKLMRQPKAQWWKGKRPLAEWFAEGYSWCARYARIVSIRKYALYRYRPTAKQHRQVCALIKRAPRDRTPPRRPTAPPVVTGDPAPPAPPPVSTGVVPGDRSLDPGPAPPESPTATPTPSPTRAPTRTPVPTIIPPLPIPTVIPPLPIVDDHSAWSRMKRARAASSAGSMPASRAASARASARLQASGSVTALSRSSR